MSRAYSNRKKERRRTAKWEDASSPSDKPTHTKRYFSKVDGKYYNGIFPTIKKKSK